jgi:hypothetical protein
MLSRACASIYEQLDETATFRQNPWLKSYIALNTKMHQLPKNDFEKDFFKLIVNALFGKSMENVRKRRKVDLIGDATKLKKLLSKQQLEQFIIVNEDLMLMDKIRSKLALNKRTDIGFTVLDLSKTLIFDFHYNVMHKQYRTDARLRFSDASSLCYIVFTDNLYLDILEY